MFPKYVGEKWSRKQCISSKTHLLLQICSISMSFQGLDESSWHTVCLALLYTQVALFLPLFWQSTNSRSVYTLHNTGVILNGTLELHNWRQEFCIEMYKQLDLRYIFCCIVYLSQIFPTMFKPRDIIMLFMTFGCLFLYIF